MATVQVPVRYDTLDVEVPDGFELLDGVLVEKPVSKDSSVIGSRIHGELYLHCKQTGAGEALHGDTAFRCFPTRPRHVRKPDVSFIRRDRFEAVVPGPGDFTIPPDFVVEVTSPNETVAEVNAKVNDFRSVGVPLIWVIDPDNRQATIYTPATIREVGEGDELPVDDVLPGFRLRLADVLLPPTPPPAAGSEAP
jgi:Uma2 family endonuclease